MTKWTPDLSNDGNRETPLYRALAGAIERAISAGELTPGDRLPTQRALARRLDIALTTVTRGYAEAEKRGLVRGEVGRGTFVHGLSPEDVGDARIDFRPNFLLPHPMLADLTAGIAHLVERGDPRELLGYGPHGGDARHREGGARWIARQGLDSDPDQVLVTAGVQHAMAVVFSTILEPGDTLLVEKHTYAGMKSLAHLLHVRLTALPMDAEGLLPDALDVACGRGAAALYCMSTLQNPTSAVMSEARRDAIAEVLDRHGVPLVEDDSYAFVEPGCRPISARYDRAFYLNGTSKSILPTLRVGYLCAPAGETARLEAAISSTVYMASALTAELAARWIENGTADDVVAWKREEFAARTEIVSEVLRDYDYVTRPASPHGWLRLPEPWCARDLVPRAEQQGVDVTAADQFSVGRDADHAVRICVGPPSDRALVEEGARRLARILEETPGPIRTIA